LEPTGAETDDGHEVALNYVNINNDIDDGSYSFPKKVNLEKGALIMNLDEREEI
jgi:hypothetical protein